MGEVEIDGPNMFLQVADHIIVRSWDCQGLSRIIRDAEPRHSRSGLAVSGGLQGATHTARGRSGARSLWVFSTTVIGERQRHMSQNGRDT